MNNLFCNDYASESYRVFELRLANAEIHLWCDGEAPVGSKVSKNVEILSNNWFDTIRFLV